MKAIFVVSLLTLPLAAAAWADVPGPGWMPEARVKALLEKEGYRYVTPLEADDGHWEGEAVHDGRIVEFYADPHSGRILVERGK